MNFLITILLCLMPLTCFGGMVIGSGAGGGYEVPANTESFESASFPTSGDMGYSFTGGTRALGGEYGSYYAVLGNCETMTMNDVVRVNSGTMTCTGWHGGSEDGGSGSVYIGVNSTNCQGTCQVSYSAGTFDVIFNANCGYESTDGSLWVDNCVFSTD